MNRVTTQHKSDPGTQALVIVLSQLVGPDQTFELRGFAEHEFPTNKLFRSDDLDAAARYALEQNRTLNVYFTLNPVDPSLTLARGQGATDKDIVRRRLILFDFDPRRPSKTSSTAAEKATAKAVALAVREHLKGEGWPDPIFADSGNGYHLVYLIDLPTDDQALVKRCLAALAQRFGTAAVDVDTSVYNPSRVSKLYGTLMRKGPDTAERPHRRSCVIEAPGHLEAVPGELLEALADSVLMAGLADEARPDPDPQPRPWGVTASPSDLTLAAEALPSINGDHLSTYTGWLKVGFALRGLGPPGLALWDEWSKGDPKKYERGACAKKWKTMTPDEAGGITLGSIFYWAAQGGWKRPQANAAAQATPNPSDNENGPAPSGVGSAGFADFPPQVRPIRADLESVPKMVPELIPGPFRNWLVDIADRVGCPLDFVAIAAVIMVATVVGRKLAIRPKRHDDWTVVANLWGMIVAPPGMLKTPALEEAMKPVRRLEMKDRECHEQALKDFQIAQAVAQAQADAAKSALKSAAKSKKSEAEMAGLAAEALGGGNAAEPVLRRRILNDTTVEKLGEVLKENPIGVALFRDEIMGLFKTLEKQGHEADRAFFLEAWNGKNPFVFDRIGRGTIFVEHVVVSILGGIQPGPLAKYIRAVASGDCDDGLISRFQLAIYPDIEREWRNVDRWPDSAAKQAAFDIFEKLDEFDAAKFHQGDELEPGDIPYTRFDPDAQSFFNEWRVDLEVNKLRADSISAGLESHLAKFRSLMPSLALLFHLVDVASNKASRLVSLDAARLSAAWCDYLEQHARRIYQAAAEGDIEPAQRLAERIKASLPNPFTVRQVVKKGWSGLDSSESVERAVAILEEHGWLGTTEVPPGSAGGRPSTQVWINPVVRGDQ